MRRNEYSKKNQMACPQVNEVQVVGWYNKKNIGDEAYKAAFPALFDCQFRFSDTPSPDAKSYVLGGGDILSPAFLKPLLKMKGRKFIASTSFPEKIDSSLFGQFESVIVRDQQSLLNARKNGVPAIFAPDFAFVLNGSETRGRKAIVSMFQESKTDLYEKVVGVVVNSHLMPSHDGSAIEASRFDRFCYELARSLDLTNASVVFIPFGRAMPWDDRTSNSLVASRLKFYKKSVCIYEEMSVQKTLDLVSSLDCLVSTRLHSTIFAIANSVPFIDITHNHKGKNQLRTLSLEKTSLPYERANVEDIRVRISDVLNRRDEIKKELESITAQQRALLRETVANVSFA